MPDAPPDGLPHGLPPGRVDGRVDGAVADARAATAADAVRVLFGRRLAALPGTWLPTVTGPGRRVWRGPWHYWWHAHVLDALVDEALRDRAAGRHTEAADAVRRATALLRTLRLRNLGTFRNHYYDDMAWLALAAGRLDRLGHARGPIGVARAAERRLTPTLRLGDTPELGGGVYWNDTHDFKNVPASAPAALHFARTGDLDRARRVADWILARLVDSQTGLVLDGLRIGPDGSTALVADIYTYNQGTVLGLLVELGDPASLARAADLVAAVRAHLTTDPAGRVLRGHGGHDGGLFTGILVRYLALAAHSPGLDAAARATAVDLVTSTADALWTGRRSITPPPRSGMPSAPVPVFSPEPVEPADETRPRGIPVELSTQVQAWTILEAAASLRPSGRSPRMIA